MNIIEKMVLRAQLRIAEGEYSEHMERFCSFINSMETYHLGIRRFNDPEWTVLYTLTIQAEVRRDAIIVALADGRL